ncbi:MAG: DUF2079 domain-containing protein [Ardenticatenaceae bacterium]|nr:DUF2079 domain-containing protein [Ardenticatenaceae bacterium]
MSKFPATSKGEGGRGQSYRWPLLMIALWTAVLATYAVLRHDRLNSSVFDFGIKSQVIWNTYQGDWFASTIEVEHYLGDHVQLIFVLLAPLFALWEDPRVLLLVQSLLLGLAGLPLYRIARRKLQDDHLALIITAAYLLYPTVGFVNRFDFHPLTFVIFFFFLSYDLLEIKKPGWASVVLALALFTREDVGFTIGFFGLYLALVHRRWKFGLLWGAVGWGWFLFTIFGIIPYFRGATSDSLGRYAWLGGSVSEMVETLFRRPGVVIDHLFGEPLRRRFLLMIFLPVGFLALLSPLTLAIGLPVVAYNLLSDVPSQSSIYFQYISPLIPFLFIATVEGIAKLQRWLPFSPSRSRLLVGVWLLLAVGISWALENPFTTPINDPFYPVYGLERLSDRAAFDEAVSLLPADAPVSTMMAYGPHVALRRRYDLFHARSRMEERPYGVAQSEYLLLHLTDLRWGVNARTYYAAIEKAIGLFNYEAIYFGNDVVLLTRTAAPQPATGALLQRVIDLQEAGGKYAPTGQETLDWLGAQWVTDNLPSNATPVSANFEPTIELVGYSLPEETLTPGRPLCPILYWQTDSPIDPALTVFLHLAAADGFVQAQRDSEPAFGFYPTPKWRPGEVVGDMHCLQIPVGLAPGEYTLLVGLYDGATGERRPLSRPPAANDAYPLTKITVE